MKAELQFLLEKFLTEHELFEEKQRNLTVTNVLEELANVYNAKVFNRRIELGKKECELILYYIDQLEQVALSKGEL